MQVFFVQIKRRVAKKNEVAVPYYRFPSAGASMFVDRGVLMVVDICAHLKPVVFEAVLSHVI